MMACMCLMKMKLSLDSLFLCLYRWGKKSTSLSLHTRVSRDLRALGLYHPDVKTNEIIRRMRGGRRRGFGEYSAPNRFHPKSTTRCRDTARISTTVQSGL